MEHAIAIVVGVVVLERVGAEAAVAATAARCQLIATAAAGVVAVCVRGTGVVAEAAVAAVVAR